MKSFFSHIILNLFSENREGSRKLTSYEQAKAFRILRVSIITTIKDFLLILGGVMSASFGLRGFLLPSHFIDGGATGISLLITSLSGISISVLLIVINLPFVIIGATNVSRDFALKTALGIAGLSLAVAF